MKILYCAEINSNSYSINSTNFDYYDKYDIHIIGELIYCCEALEKNFWLELIQPDNIQKEKYNEPKIVLGFANYSGGYTIMGGSDGIRFCPFCGEEIKLEKINCNTN